MQFTNRLKLHPLRLLLYLEWILFLISIVGHFRSKYFPPISIEAHPFLLGANSHYSVVSSLFIIAFILLGIWQPDHNKTLNQIVYIGLGFLLISLTMATGGAQFPLFLPLLLIMVIRGCLIFDIAGSFITASISVTWFLISLYLVVKNNFINLELEQIPAIITPGIEPEIIYRLYSNEEQLQSIIVNMAINITMLFCLITVFVFLLVNALMSEYRSRQELRLVNQQLREYALLIEDRAMLQERNRIAREIHDSLGHSLTALNIQLANSLLYLHSNLDRSETFLNEAKKMGSHALQEVRQSVSTLRCDPLQGKLLNTALLDLVNDLKYRTEITINYQNEIFVLLPQEITSTVYRIVQEAMTNIVKHSQATMVNISLKLITEELKITIQDNGVGFDTQENTTGFGLKGMYERATSLGGKLNLITVPNRGCKIVAVIPLLNK